MRRRAFIALMGGAALWPLAAVAQRQQLVVGYLNSASRSDWAIYLEAFLHGLKEAGYVDGDNVAIEYRWADHRYDRLPELAGDLVRREVSAIYCDGGTVTSVAAHAATKTIPIVFTMGTDPIRAGLVASVNRPGGNMTGVTVVTNLVIVKRLELIQELLPGANTVALLLNPNNPNIQDRLDDLRTAAQARGWQVKVLLAGNEPDLATAFASLGQRPAGGLLVQADPFFFSQRHQLAALAMRHSVPAIYEDRAYAEAGGLISYGADRIEPRRLGGIYTGRILKGEKPADLPVLQPTKFELVINLKAARALGLKIPDKLLFTADEAIE